MNERDFGLRFLEVNYQTNSKLSVSSVRVGGLGWLSWLAEPNLEPK